MEALASEAKLETLLSIDDAALLLRVSKASIYRLMRTGDLEAVTIGRRTLFEPDALRALIERSRRRRGP